MIFIILLFIIQHVNRLVVSNFTLMLSLTGVGLLGAVDTVGRMETRAEHLLLSLTVATAHRLDDIIQVDGLLLLSTHNQLNYKNRTK